MTSPFDSMIAFPVSRAQAYAHTWPEDPSPEDAPIVELDVQHLLVDTMVYPGTVTLAASTLNAGSDAYGFEYDLTPSDARALGNQLIAAAAECEGALPDQSDPRTESQKMMRACLEFPYDSDWHNYRGALLTGGHSLDGREHDIGSAECCAGAEPLHKPEELQAGQAGRPWSNRWMTPSSSEK